MRNRRWTGLVLALLLAASGQLAAQDLGDDSPRASELRQLIQDRFAARVQQDLGLTDQQASQMREVVASYFGKRRAMEVEDRRLRQALAGELRPGVAARKENLSRYTDQLLDLKIRYAQSYKDEAKELAAFLDPVQVAQYLVLREQLLAGIRQAQEQRDSLGPVRRRLRP